MVKERTNPGDRSAEETLSGNQLFLFNDEHHTFDYVIDSLVEVCNHDPEQAEQCAFIAHFKGKCAVKAGDTDFLKKLQAELQSRDLTVAVE